MAHPLLTHRKFKWAAADSPRPAGLAPRGSSSLLPLLFSPNPAKSPIPDPEERQQHRALTPARSSNPPKNFGSAPLDSMRTRNPDAPPRPPAAAAARGPAALAFAQNRQSNGACLTGKASGCLPIFLRSFLVQPCLACPRFSPQTRGTLFVCTRALSRFPH
ncbi:unnamed protein product [Urochloa humidicola]